MNHQQNITSPKIWINVTSSVHWNRPPVGIIRVEQELSSRLEDMFPKDQFGRCIWQNNQFIEWNANHQKIPSFEWDEIGIPPKMATFDLSFKKIFKRKKKLAISDLTSVETTKVESKNTQEILFKKGDILISIGLDWDQPYTESFFSLKKEMGVKIITCCYDLIPILFPQYCVGQVPTHFHEYLNRLAWGSSATLCISKQTQEDFLNFCNQTGAPLPLTKVIPLGDNITKPINDDILPAIERLCTDRFILFVSTIERRKNHEVLYRAYHLLCKQGFQEDLPKLVFVGMPGWGVNDLLKDIELDPDVSGMIVQLNHVSDSELGYLYKHAYFCVYPSLYEGWGLPVGEALASGKAVLASDRGSLPEIGGELVCYLDAWNAQAWADKILEWSQNPRQVKEIEKRVKEEYKAREWSDCASSVHSLILELLLENNSDKMIFYPGYDLSTQMGIHMGPYLQAVGSEGYIMYGPYIYLEQGAYWIEIFDIPENRIEGVLNIDCVSQKGQNVYFSQELNVERKQIKSKTDLLMRFHIDLSENVEDFEIRCYVSQEVRITLSKIVITKININ